MNICSALFYIGFFLGNLLLFYPPILSNIYIRNVSK